MHLNFGPHYKGFAQLLALFCKYRPCLFAGHTRSPHLQEQAERLHVGILSCATKHMAVIVYKVSSETPETESESCQHTFPACSLQVFSSNPESSSSAMTYST